MTRKLMGTIATTAVLLLVPLAAWAQTSTRVSLDHVMAPEERVATGVANLSASQKASLESWLARYTATVSAVARGIGSAPAVRDAQRSAPEETIRSVPRPAPALEDTIRPRQRHGPHNVPEGVRVYRSAGGGTFVMLEDGSMWEIFLRDRPYTVTWRTGDYVLVRRNSAPLDGYEFTLVNSAGRMEASARFAGRVELQSEPESR